MKFKLKRSKDNQFYFIIVASNGRTLLQSETYKVKSSCTKTLKRINNNFKVLKKVIDETI